MEELRKEFERQRGRIFPDKISYWSAVNLRLYIEFLEQQLSKQEMDCKQCKKLGHMCDDCYSNDKAMRIEGRDWWDEEELFMKDSNAALDLYKKVKPRIVISHDCPEIAKIVLLTWRQKFNIPSRTNQLLQAMFEFHQPSFWYFAHYHISKKFVIHNTQFQALNELEKIEIDI